MLCKIGFHSLCEFAPRKQNAMTTAFAFEADVRAEAHHSPFVGAAGMWFAQTKKVVELEIGKHVSKQKAVGSMQ